jgi:hypothetical protein
MQEREAVPLMTVPLLLQNPAMLWSQPRTSDRH